MKKFGILITVFILLTLTSCAINRTHTIQYPASGDLFVTSGDDPGSESEKAYIPKGKVIQFNQEIYWPIPIAGIWLKSGNAEPQHVFDNYVIPKVKSMGADALTDAYVGYTPEDPWIMGLLGIRKGQSTLVIGQAVKR